MRRLGTLCFALLVMALAASIARAEAPAPADATPALDAVSRKYPDLHGVLAVCKFIITPGSTSFLVGFRCPHELANDLLDFCIC